MEMIKEYFLRNAKKVLKMPNGKLKHPFVDPGADSYAGNLWDWDSYFTVKGLMGVFSAYFEEELAQAGLTHERIASHAKGCVLNFLASQEEDGYIPIMISGEDLFAGYFHAEHEKGVPLNQHKPFLCQSALQAGEFANDYDWIESEKLKKYLAYYETKQYDKKSGLFFWQDDIMIGIDNNPTVFYHAPRSSADVYLNCFLYEEYRCMAEILRRRGEDCEEFVRKAEALKVAIDREMWDERDGIYYSQDIKFYRAERKFGDSVFHEGLAPSWNTMPLKIRFWGCFLPLTFGICNRERAERLCKHLEDGEVFARYGIRTLARNEKMYDLSKSSNPSNWLGAIWIVSNYLIYEGLVRYGKSELAERLRTATCELLEANLEKYGEMFESYQPDTGEPNLHPGFLSWNLLAIIMNAEK